MLEMASRTRRKVPYLRNGAFFHTSLPVLEMVRVPACFFRVILKLNAKPAAPPSAKGLPLFSERPVQAPVGQVPAVLEQVEVHRKPVHMRRAHSAAFAGAHIKPLLIFRPEGLAKAQLIPVGVRLPYELGHQQREPSLHFRKLQGCPLFERQMTDQINITSFRTQSITAPHIQRNVLT